MTRRSSLFVVLLSAALIPAASLAWAARAAAPLQVPAGSRVGVINLLDAEVTHFHESRHIENSFLKTYAVNWPVNAMLLTGVKERLTQLGLVPVPLAASDELQRARENCFLNATLAKGLPKECGKLYAQLGAAQHLAALIVLGPGRNDSAHAGGARHRELPEYLRGWCFVTGQGAADAPPQLINLTELLLIGVNGSAAALSDREWGGDGGNWSGYQAPADLKAIPDAQLDQLRPLFAALLKGQVQALFAYLQVAH
ncbi:MAG TPA: hypothetical protein VIH60_08480 [Steroidobacteraceae bacterium]|jgi:hypothetical protein